MKILQIPAALLALLFLRCSDATAPYLPPVGIPLNIGNVWRYQADTFDTTGAVMASTIITHTITKDTTIAGTTWFIRETSASSDTTVSRQILQNRGAQLYFFDTATRKEYLRYDFSIQESDSFLVVIPLRCDSSATISIVATSVDLPIETPVGPLACTEFSNDEFLLWRPYGPCATVLVMFTTDEYIGPLGILRTDLWYSPERRFVYSKIKLVSCSLN